MHGIDRCKLDKNRRSAIVIYLEYNNIEFGSGFKNNISSLNDIIADVGEESGDLGLVMGRE